MQFFPVNRAPSPKKTDETEVKSVYAAKPVREAKFAPFLAELKLPARPRAQAPSEKPQTEQAFRDRVGEERRKYCRRLQNRPVLYELRVTEERRKRNQRKDDITTSIDEKV